MEKKKDSNQIETKNEFSKRRENEFDFCVTRHGCLFFSLIYFILPLLSSLFSLFFLLLPSLVVEMDIFSVIGEEELKGRVKQILRRWTSSSARSRLERATCICEESPPSPSPSPSPSPVSQSPSSSQIYPIPSSPSISPFPSSPSVSRTPIPHSRPPSLSSLPPFSRSSSKTPRSRSYSIVSSLSLSHSPHIYALNPLPSCRCQQSDFLFLFEMVDLGGLWKSDCAKLLLKRKVVENTQPLFKGKQESQNEEGLEKKSEEGNEKKEIKEERKDQDQKLEQKEEKEEKEEIQQKEKEKEFDMETATKIASECWRTLGNLAYYCPTICNTLLSIGFLQRIYSALFLFDEIERVSKDISSSSSPLTPLQLQLRVDIIRAICNLATCHRTHIHILQSPVFPLILSIFENREQTKMINDSAKMAIGTIFHLATNIDPNVRSLLLKQAGLISVLSEETVRKSVERRYVRAALALSLLLRPTDLVEEEGEDPGLLFFILNFIFYILFSFIKIFFFL